jgi:UPF0271 protein
LIDISADLGEGSPREGEIWELITSANVACGGHVGDERSMRDAARHAVRCNVRLGAHPSYPDVANFGRKTLNLPHDELRRALAQQIGALRAVAVREGIALLHVKPHGALYNDAHRDRALADVIVSAMRDVDGTLAIVCSASSQMAAAAHAVHMPVIREAFADRRYTPDGALQPRSQSGSTLTIDEAAEQAELLAEDGVVITTEGTTLLVPFDTICIHADMEHAVERLRAVRARIVS